MNLGDRNILVTGGAGQIGSRLVPALLEHGAMVVVLDREAPGRFSVNRDPHRGNLKYYQCDVSDPEAFRVLARKSLQGIHQVIHLASRISNDVSTSAGVIDDLKSDLLGTVHLLDALPPLQAFCYTSSIMVYGRGRQSLIDENHPTEPENTYGILKLATEKVLRIYAAQTGCAVAILRLCGLRAES